MKIKLLRFFKRLFIRLHLHVIFGWSEGFCLQLVWMSRLSRWTNANKKIPLNDFPSQWDYQKRYQLYEYVYQKKIEGQPFHYLEFGVANGDSFRWWSKRDKNPNSEFDGFDTFTGLPEDFGQYKKGTFNTGNSVPALDDTRCKFHAGLFQQTLPSFLKCFENDKRLVIMMDADLYSSTLFVLSYLAPYLKKGDIVFFDEFGVPLHEFRAFTQFQESFYLPMEPVATNNNYYFMAFQVK
ncbi:MAG: class I SAM-dependent methyltransferase [Chitinophagaceae bacterium]|nr:class I SAM-dependent methyltransferase [Chitinophagaceae bacterium]